MSKSFWIDKKSSISTAMEVPAFPWVRTDAGRFIWEEVLYEGNYLSIHHSAIGRCQSKENIFSKLTKNRFPRERLYGFEIEADGQLLRDKWQWLGERIVKTPEGFQELLVELSFETVPLKVTVHTLLDGTQFLVRWLEIRNAGDKPVALSRVFPWTGQIACEEEGNTIFVFEPDKGFSVGHYLNSCWGMEGEFTWEPLTFGTFSMQSSGNKHRPPLYMLRNETIGEITIIHIESTINDEVMFTRGYESNYGVPARPWGANWVYAKAGVGGKAPLLFLNSGEVIQTPRIHLSIIQGDIDVAVNALYEHLRKSVVLPQPAGSAHLVEYNHTGYTLNAQVSKDLLRQEVDISAELGIELFLVDAGWYGPKEKGWYQVVGDWTENEILGEGGLLEVFDYARSKGMKCGLWMPPEWVGNDSQIYRNKTNWFFPGSTTFNLFLPEVEKYIYDTICGAIEKFKLDCYRIDGGSSDIGESKDSTRRMENLSWRYYDKLYGIYERVQKRFPKVLLENCSGGGGRCDLGMMRRFHFTQISDNWDPPCQIRILNGMTIGLTPEQCMPLVGSINPRMADLDFVIRTGMLGHFTASGAFPNVDRINPEGMARWKHGIETYKKMIRPWLSTCRVYHHTPVQDFRQRGDWVVLEYVSKDANAVAVGIFRLENASEDSYRFIARGLDINRNYEVTYDNRGQSVRISGHELCTTGLNIRVPAPLMSELLLIKTI